MRNSILGLFAFFLVLPSLAQADSAAPEFFGVREIIIQNPRFIDAKASDTCGLSRDQVMETLTKGLLAWPNTPAIPVGDAKPPSLGVARVDLVPEIHTRADDNLQCSSWVSLSVENRAKLVVSPVSTLRSVTVVYWRQHALAVSGQSTHVQFVDELLKKMSAQLAQQYKLDQPPELSK
jgi:hypothetical protein